MKTATAPLTRGRLAAAAGCKAATIRFERMIADLPPLAEEPRGIIGQCCRDTIADGRIIDALAPRDLTA